MYVVRVTCPFKAGWLTLERPQRQAVSGSVQRPEGLVIGHEVADSFLSHLCPLGSLDIEIRLNDSIANLICCLCQFGKILIIRFLTNLTTYSQGEMCLKHTAFCPEKHGTCFWLWVLLNTKSR